MNKSTFKFYTYLLALLVVPFFLLSGCEHVNQPATTQPTPVLAKVALLANAAPLAKVAPLDCSDTGLYQELMNPPTLAAKDLNINTQLSAKLTDKCVNGKIIALQSYLDTNAGIDKRAVGPSYILDVDAQLPHPKLAIEFSNKLGDSNKIYDCGHHGKDVSQCTNLHVHGLHVSPKGSLDPAQVQSDFVFLAISPATQTVKYDYEIPSSHPPGTHWLHAHLHGSTASQLKQGMAGAIILKGALDKTLAKDYGITGSKDKVMILQQLSTDANNTPLCGKASSGENITTSINGQCLPIITVMAGDINRWRFIDAGISESINIAVVQVME